MRRKLFNVALALSLVLWLGTTALWLRARFAQDVIAGTAPADRLIRIHVKENGLVISTIAGWPRRERLSWRCDWAGRQGYGVPVMFDAKTMSGWSFFPGVSYSSGTGTATDPTLPSADATVVHGRIVVIVWAWPLALTLAFAGPLTAIAIRRWAVRRNRRAKGHCLACGYDLRATPGRCPECGVMPELASRPAA